MQKLNAIDAISPAWDHTRKLLLEPPRWTLLLKIGLVAAFAQVGGGGSYSSNNFGNHSGLGHHIPMHLPVLAALATLFLVIGFIVFLVALAFFYLACRLQFVLFDIVLRRDTTVAPIWRRYGPATWRWMGFRILFILVALICVSPILVPAVIRLIHAFTANQAATEPDLLTLLAPFFAFIASLLLAAILISIGSTLLHDFGLPSMALESTSFGETVNRVGRLIRAEPLQILLFLVMKFVLRIVTGIGVGIALILGFLILLLPFGGAGGVLFATLHHSGTGGLVFMWFAIVLLALAYVVLIFIAALMTTGVIETFFQAYALYFLGGRYPMLGDILLPTPLPPAGLPFAQPAFTPTPPTGPAIA